MNKLRWRVLVGVVVLTVSVGIAIAEPPKNASHHAGAPLNAAPKYNIRELTISHRPSPELAASVDTSETSHRYEHCSSWSKPSSESHTWSYEGACNNCLAEVERRHGVDWKVTDVEFEDKGRTTNTSSDWRGRRKWKCTHCVVAKYNIVRRGHESSEVTRTSFKTV